MATKEVSCETTIKKKLHLNFKDLDKHYDGDGKLMFQPEVLPQVGVLPTPYMSSFELVEVVVRDYPNAAKYVSFTCSGVKNLKCEVDLEVLLADSSKIKIVESCNVTPFGDEWNMPGWFLSVHRIRMSKVSRIQTITGVMTLTFEPEDGHTLKDELIYRFGELFLGPWTDKPEKPADIKLECQGEKIDFHKSLLSKISDVFKIWLKILTLLSLKMELLP